MESHMDDEHLQSQVQSEFIQKLQTRATKAMDAHASTITGGDVEEPVLDEWENGGIHVTKRPDDEQDILRISVGGGSSILKIDYCVFRGDRTQCAYLLEQAAKALRDGHELKTGPPPTDS